MAEHVKKTGSIIGLNKLTKGTEARVAVEMSKLLAQCSFSRHVESCIITLRSILPVSP